MVRVSETMKLYYDLIVPRQYSVSSGEWLSIDLWCNYSRLFYLEDENIALLADRKSKSIKYIYIILCISC